MAGCLAALCCVAMAGDSPSAEALVGGIACEEGSAAWYGLRVGMTLDEAEELLSVRLSSARDEFSGWVATTDLRGVGVRLALADGGRDARVSSITLTIPEPLDVRAMARTLMRHHPTGEYRASRHAPELKELDNPTPGYLLCDQHEAYVLLKPQLVWIQLGQSGE